MADPGDDKTLSANIQDTPSPSDIPPTTADPTLISDKNPGGRTPVLDERKRRIVLALLTNGGSLRMAARYVGHAPSTIYRAIQRDPEFAQAVAAAEQSAEIEALQSLRRAGKKERYWRAAAWLLERKNPEDFAPRPFTAISNQQISQLFFLTATPFINKMSDEEFDQALQQLDDVLRQLRAYPKEANQILASHPSPEAPTLASDPLFGDPPTGSGPFSREQTTQSNSDADQKHAPAPGPLTIENRKPKTEN